MVAAAAMMEVYGVYDGASLLAKKKNDGVSSCVCAKKVQWFGLGFVIF